MLLTVLCFIGMGGQRAFAELQDVIDTRDQLDVLLYQGDLVSLKVFSLTRIAISKPGVVEIGEYSVDEIQLIGKNVGETPIFIWDEYGKRTVMARVLPMDLDLVISRANKLLESAEIKGVTFTKNQLESKVVATGILPKADIDKIQKTLEAVGNDHFLYMLSEDEEAVIQIDVQVSELNTTLQKALGFDWSTGAKGLIIPYEETLPGTEGAFDDLFKIGDFARTQELLATVNLLIREGKGRVLSKPSIVVRSEEEATFLVGGEIPILNQTTSASLSTTQITVSYKKYGVELTVKPTILDDNLIDMTVDISIKDIDAANAVGNNVAFTSREAKTILNLQDGQTTVIAGFIRHNESESVSRVPFLGNLPIVGLLFRNKFMPSPYQEQEVVVSITPRIIRYSKISVSNDEAMVPDEVVEEQFLKDMKKDVVVAAEDSPSSELISKAAETVVDVVPPESAIVQEDEGPLTEKDLMEGESEPQPLALEQPASVAAASEAGEDQEEKSVDNIPSEIKAVEQDISQMITVYVQTIQQKIAETISFPYEAKEKGWEGTVKLTLTVLNDGSLEEVSLKETSGYDVFDKDALNTTRILAPFEPFPKELGLEELVVTIPIVYSQESVVLDEAK
jgi:pilus assembly protein CpaC